MGSFLDFLKVSRVKESSCKAVPAGTILINRRNTSKTSLHCPNCGSWIKHWTVLSDQTIPAKGDCAVSGCNGRTKNGDLAEIVGCHVMIKKTGNDEDRNVYIAPLCESCNLRADGDEMTLKRDVVLVRANVAETCDRL